ncbi:alpha/beta hydrolase [Myxococcaceae bacterium GXIMD 01537]
MPPVSPNDRYAGLEPRTRAFLEELLAAGGPPIYTLSPLEARGVLRSLQEGDVAKLPADFEERLIPGGPTGQVPVRIVRPQGVTGPLPAVVYCHGGGWVLGDRETHDRLVRQLAVGCQAAIVFVEYTPSPEAQYPVAVEQSYAVAKWVSESGDQANLARSRLVIAGDSVGGNMVAAVTLLARQRKGPRIDLQVLFYPVTDGHLDTASYQAFADGFWLSREAMRWFWDCYQPDVGGRAAPTVSPLRAPVDQLRGLPPAIIFTAEFDVLRDEGEAYGRKLAEAGVGVTALRCLGTIHDFVMLDALADTPAPRAAVRQAILAIREALGPLRAGAPAGAARAGPPPVH